jgi:hypothetical protein
VVIGNGRLKSAGTEEIARASGGDSMTVDNVSALQDTLERIRQSYALYFNAPEGVKQGEKRNVQIALTGAATRRYQNAELRYRPSYVVSEGSTTSGPSTSSDDTPTVTRRNPGTNDGVFDRKPAQTEDSVQDAPKPKRRVAVDEPGSGSGGFRRVGTAPAPVEKEAETVVVPAKTAEVKPAAVPVKEEAKPAAEDSKPGGFRRIKPGEKP